MPRENTKEKLIDAAILCLQEQGYESTSVSLIVKRANVAQGTFYIYFKTKYDMVLAIANRILSEQLLLCEKIEYQNKSFETFLFEWIKIVFYIMEKNQSLIGYVTAKSAEKDRYISWEKLYEPYYTWMDMMIEYYQSVGECIIEKDNKALVVLLIGTVEESAEQYYLFTSKPPSVDGPIDLVHRLLVRSIVIKEKRE
jgi:hypothetical protein